MKEIIILIVSLAAACITGMIYRYFSDRKDKKDE